MTDRTEGNDDDEHLWLLAQVLQNAGDMERNKSEHHSMWDCFAFLEAFQMKTKKTEQIPDNAEYIGSKVPHTKL